MVAMVWIVVAIGIAILFLEQIIPDQKLPAVKGWWARVILINGFQLLVIIVSGFTLTTWLQDWSLFQLNSLPSIVSGFIVYVIITFIFYWWHRIRHDVDFIWRIFHQIHHSASRIEVVTSLFKHPVEIFVNSVLIAVINYSIFGLTIDAAAWVLLFAGCGEYFYHMNIKTPHWVGYFIQRPEMHRIHHQRNVHHYNYADLPIWDILFGTYKNPKEFYGKTGFEPKKEQKFKEMLLGKDVHKEKKKN